MTVTPNVIVEAATKGDLAKLSRLLYDHPDLADVRKEEDGPTPLMAASKGGHLGVVKLLLRCGVHVDAVDAHGWSAMYYAGMAGHGAIVEALLERSASVDIRDVCGWNALTVACAYGHLPVVLRLLEEYPDEAGKATCLRKASRSIDAQSTSGETAFWWACYFDHAQVAKTLLLRGADHAIADEEGRSPKGLATQRGRRAALAVIEWYEGELARADLLQRMRGLADALHTHVSGTPDTPRQVSETPDTHSSEAKPHDRVGDGAFERCLMRRLAQRRPLPEWVGGSHPGREVGNEGRSGRIGGEHDGGKEEGKGSGKCEGEGEEAGQALRKEEGGVGGASGGQCGNGGGEGHGDTESNTRVEGEGGKERRRHESMEEGEGGHATGNLEVFEVEKGCKLREASGACGEGEKGPLTPCLDGEGEDEIGAMLEWAREQASAELFVELMQGMRLR